MSNPNKGQFENAWKDAFEDAEMMPNMDVWAGIDDRLLAAQQANQKKRRGFFWMSAAAVTLFILGSFTGWFISRQHSDATLALQPHVVKDNNTHYNAGSSSPLPTTDPYLADASNTDAQAGTNTSVHSTGGSLLPDRVQQLEANKRNPIQENAEKIRIRLRSHTSPESASATIALQAGRLPKQSFESKNYTAPTLAVTDASFNQAIKAAYGKTATTGTEQQAVHYSDMLALQNESTRNEGPVLPDTEEAATDAIALTGSTTENTAGESATGLAEAKKENSLKKLFTFAKPRKEKEIWIAEHSENERKNDKQATSWISLGVTPSQASAGIGAARSGSIFSNSSADFARNSSSNTLFNPNESLVHDQRPEASFIVSVQAGQYLGERWQLVSGLQYIRNQSSFTTSSFYMSPNNPQLQPVVAVIFEDGNTSRHLQNAAPSNSTVGYFNSTAKERLYNQVQYMGIPVKVNFLFARKKRFNMHVSSGLAADVFINSNLESTNHTIASNTYQSSETSSYRSITMSGLVGLGASYQYSDKYSINLEPTFRQAIFSSLRSSTGLRSLPANAGIEVSLRRNL